MGKGISSVQLGLRYLVVTVPSRPVHVISKGGGPAAPTLAGNPAANKVLVIDDILEADISGAACEGYDSLLHLDGGIHDEEGTESLDASVICPTYFAWQLV